VEDRPIFKSSCFWSTSEL